MPIDRTPLGVVTLRQGDATPKDIILYALPTVAITGNDIFLCQGDATPKDIILRQVPGVAEATGGSVTLTADEGSFSHSGQAALFQTQLVAAVGSDSLTGQDAAFQTQLVAAVGSDSLTGQDAAFTLTLVAETGYFTLGGQDADLTEQQAVRAGGSGRRSRSKVEYWWERNDPRERLWKHTEPPVDEPPAEPFDATTPQPNPTLPRPAYAEIAAAAVADELIRRAQEATRTARRRREQEEEALLMELLDD